MTKLFLDTNVVLDLLGEREPHYNSVAKLASLADRKKIAIVASALTYATVNYLLTKYMSPEKAIEKLRKFKVISEISDLTEQTIEKSLNSNFKDFEDALQYFSALNAECSIIITRNAKDFKFSNLPVMSVEEYLNSENYS